MPIKLQSNSQPQDGIRPPPRTNYTISTSDFANSPGQELSNDTLPKAVRNPTLVIFPVRGCITRIGPEKIIEQAVVGYIGGTLDTTDIVHV